MIKQLFTAAALMVSLNVMANPAIDNAVNDLMQNNTTTTSTQSNNVKYYNDCYRQKADNPMEAMMDGMEDMMDSFDNSSCNGGSSNNDSFWKFWN
jgi:hypothetical protein